MLKHCEGCRKLFSFAINRLVGYLCVTNRSSFPDVFLLKGPLKICSKFIGEHSRKSVISICDFSMITNLFSKTFTWIFSCKFTAFFQNTFLYKYIWRTASGLGKIKTSPSHSTGFSECNALIIYLSCRR